jgi:regulator of extracellular matrix RemA (YlzA/DUF370 family)
LTGAILKFIHIGFGYIVCANRIVGVFPTKAEQTKRMIRYAKASETYVDMTRGRETKSFILLEDGMLISCAFNPLTVLKRLNEGVTPKDQDWLSTGGGQPVGKETAADLHEIELEIDEEDQEEEEIGEEDSE